MTDKIVVLVTCGTSEEAARIAKALLEERLAACANIVGPVRSLYRWEGKVNDDQEMLIVIKSSRSVFERLRHVVENLHTYHVPEVICLPIIDGAPNYLDWLAESIASPPEHEATQPEQPAGGGTSGKGQRK